MKATRFAYVAAALAVVCFSMLAPGGRAANLRAACILTITCPPDRAIECDQSTDPWNTGTATYTASAECGTVTLSYSDVVAPGACPQTKTITRTWTATAGSGDFATCVQTITVADTKPPAFQCPSDLSVKCLANVPPCAFGGVGAFDNCGHFYPVVCSRSDNGGRGCPGDPLIITDTYSSTDSCGNRSECHRTITVVDDVPPVLSGCPQDQTIECVGNLPLCDPQVTGVDNCDGPVPVTCSDGPLIGGPCSGTITRTYRATDRCGNTTACAQVFTVSDITPPSISCPADRQLQCGESTDPANTGVAAATDNCGGAVTIAYTDASVPANCAGTPGVDRTWKSTDACGNFATCVQHISFVDNTPPVVTTSPDIRQINDPGQCGAVVTFSASATDDCSGPLPVTCDPPSGSFFPFGATTVHCTATDACGNTGSHDLQITVFGCLCHHDPVCDSVTDLADVVAVIEVAFRAGTESFDGCLRSREDVDCNGYCDIRDVVHMIQVAFRGADPAIEFCDPCP